MNLFYLLSNRHKRLVTGGEVAPVVEPVGGLRWRGVSLGHGSFVSVLKATECQPFRGRPATVGWYGTATGSAATIEVSFVISGTDAVAGKPLRFALDAHATPIRLPWPVEPQSRPLDLVIRRIDEGAGAAFLAVHFPLDRRPILALCKGRGVELGPGPRPQVFPAADIDVRYVEQTHPDDWARLYGGSAEVTFDPALAPHFVVGDADRIPAEPGSLDFIFSSHVFEHLANPLGHLALWADLLKSGGRIAMIVPDYIGSKDFLMDETSIEVLEAEYATGGFALTQAHYDDYGRARGNPDLGADLMKKKASIHVHYYSHGNMARVCEWAVERLGYAAFSIVHSDNHKDFYVVLEKA